MRFAGQRFRGQSGSQGRFSTPDGSVGKFNYRYQPEGLPQSRAQMPEFNARSIAKTEQPNFNIGDFSEPEFRA
jgi:hypothetical protein